MFIVIQTNAPPPGKLLSRFNMVSLLLFALAACAMLYWALPSSSSAASSAHLNLSLPAPAAHVIALDKSGISGMAGAKTSEASEISTTQSIVFAGGCFWGVQLVFQHTQGVLSAVSGYAGGQAADASYALVSSGASQHAEAVQVRYDPKQISLAQLLHIYFSVVHDPTQLNRQHPDEGAQYRSAVFVNNDGQRQVTQAYIDQLDAAKVLAAKIVTQISPLNGFYVAEPEHQNYALRNPSAPYIAQFDAPKLAALKTRFAALYSDQPAVAVP